MAMVRKFRFLADKARMIHACELISGNLASGISLVRRNVSCSSNCTSPDLHGLRQHLWLYVAHRNGYQRDLFDPWFKLERAYAEGVQKRLPEKTSTKNHPKVSDFDWGDSETLAGYVVKFSDGPSSFHETMSAAIQEGVFSQLTRKRTLHK
jgi:hypothetical protein